MLENAKAGGLVERGPAHADDDRAVLRVCCDCVHDIGYDGYFPEERPQL